MLQDAKQTKQYNPSKNNLFKKWSHDITYN